MLSPVDKAIVSELEQQWQNEKINLAFVLLLWWKSRCVNTVSKIKCIEVLFLTRGWQTEDKTWTTEQRNMMQSDVLKHGRLINEGFQRCVELLKLLGLCAKNLTLFSDLMSIFIKTLTASACSFTADLSSLLSEVMPPTSRQAWDDQTDRRELHRYSLWPTDREPPCTTCSSPAQLLHSSCTRPVHPTPEHLGPPADSKSPLIYYHWQTGTTLHYTASNKLPTTYGISWALCALQSPPPAEPHSR